MKRVALKEGASVMFWDDGIATIQDNPAVGVGEREGQVQGCNFIPLALALLREAGAEIKVNDESQVVMTLTATLNPGDTVAVIRGGK